MSTDELLKVLISEVQGLRRDLAGGSASQRQRSSLLTRADHEFLARLVPAIVAELDPEELFTSRELVAKQAPSLRLLLELQSPRSLGRLLTRAAGTPIAGYVIERIGAEWNVALWRLRRQP